MFAMNRTVLMSGAEYFSGEFAINAHMDPSVQVNVSRAIADHKSIEEALISAGVEVIKVPAPAGCQDGVYTANWGLVRGNKAILSTLPNARRAEEPYAEQILHGLGKEVKRMPHAFSGQGDALPCGNLLFVGSAYRTDLEMHKILADELGYEVIGLQTVPKYDDSGEPVINAVTGWPDSFFYDLDLALGVLRADLIAWCPEAFLPKSQDKIRSLPIDKIEVSLEEATKGFACNLISTGETVIMSTQAPQLADAITDKGLKVITPEVEELGKGGGFIRCTTLTLDNG